MSLEAVKEEIIKNAKEQETALIAGARKEASSIMKAAEKKVEEVKEKSEAEAKRMIDAIRRQELASAEIEGKKIVLEVKKQIIESVFHVVNKNLESLDGKKREAYIKRLLEKTIQDIEPSYIYCNKKDAKFIKGFNVETIDIIGGIIAENKDKTIRTDYSFETILGSIKETELQNINKILFG